MSIESDKKPIVLSEEDRDTLRRVFTRKITDTTNVIRLDDECATRKFLIEYRQHEEKQNRIAVATNGFNPDIHVVITKEQLDTTKHLQALTAMAKQVEEIHAAQSDVNAKVTDVHARLNGKIYKKEKPLTKKQREEEEFEALRFNAHNKLRLNGYQR